MEKSFASFTIITFVLFAVSAARISLNPPATNLPALQCSGNDESKTMKALPRPATTEDSNIILPSDTPKSNSDETGKTSETNKARMHKVDLTPRSDFARFHAINRHFFDQSRIPLHSAHHRRPNRHSVNPFPRPEISRGKEAVLFGESETSKVDAENFHRKGPLKRMNSKHDYGHRRQRHRYHHNLHRYNNGVSPKHMFSREKVKSLVRQHKEKKSRREHEAEAGFMKGIRKFLKHAFD
ncbi:unnamed protein product [Lactuca virosa]|uniref:Uncharacterized protein n=1 Tax=Lactuca virosa TaxID=75947 RepID=A0AAU9PUF7_9ASTR|nr:unnamed protein product [Lactuca virosa]